MFPDDIRIFPVRQEFISGDVTVTVQANGIIISNNLRDLIISPGSDLIVMRIVTHPAGKIVAVLCGVYTELKFRFDLFEMEFGIFWVIAMTINAGILAFHPEVARMRKSIIIFRVTISTLELPVV